MTRILSIDPGIVGCGWAVFETGPLQPVAAGCLRTAKRTRKTTVRVADDDARRVADLFRGLLRIARDHLAAGLVAELPSGGAQGARANRCMGMASALVVCLAEALELPTEWITPGEVRKAAEQARSKNEVQRYVLARWPWFARVAPGWPAAEWEHVADAAAAAAAAEHGRLVRTLTRRTTPLRTRDTTQVAEAPTAVGVNMPDLRQHH